MQKAILLDEFGERSVMKYSEIPIPEPEAGEVQVNIRATSINPVEWKIRSGSMGSYPHEFPICLGWDCAGCVTKVGYGVSQFSVGDEVFAYARHPSVGKHLGTYCQFTCLPACFVSKKPPSLSFEETACLPLTGLTAFQCLELGKVGEGSSVLIIGASGGVGSNGIEIARAKGATTVIGIASQRNFEFMSGLGATHCVDYKAEDLVDQIKAICPDGVDMILDTFGHGSLAKLHTVTKIGGHIVSIADWSFRPPAAREDIVFGTVFVEPNAVQLKQIAEWIEAGKMTHKMTGSWEWEQIVEAHEMSETAHTRGKMALKIPVVE